jgi:hypothetical protein
MPTIEELEALSTEELRDRAFHLARHKLDVGFFWNLLEVAPAVEAAAGHEDEAGVDILSLSQRVFDVVSPDTKEEADAFRPIYVDYLLEHEKPS